MRMILQRAHERLGDVVLFNGTLKIGLIEVSFDLTDETPLRDVSGAISKTKLLKRAVQLAREFARPPCPLCVLIFRCKPQSGADEQEDSAEPAAFIVPTKVTFLNEDALRRMRVRKERRN